ncbi:MAG: permease for cytosine/purine uracil thiamine allantoin family protein [Conexibacter sp.]|nr:permease for cytosine/purine uracil thiamine allantoin family protein [Conexibacter sp.]
MSVRGAVLPRLRISREDDPRVVEEAATEDYSLHVVPRTWRMSRGRLMMAWWALVTGMFYVYVAALVALTVGTGNALIGIVLAVVAYSGINAIINRAAVESGLTVALFSRGMFGFLGAGFATIIFAATAIYYFVFEGSIIAVAAQKFFADAGMSMDIKIWYLLVVALAMPLVMRGVRAWLDRLNGALLPLYGIGIVAVLVWVTSHGGGYSSGWAHLGPEHALVQGPPWLFAFSVYMGVWIFMMYTMDFGRLGRREDLGFSRVITFGPAFYVMTFLVNGLIGIYLVNALGIKQLGEGELATAIVGVTGVVGLLLILITQTRINTANLYLASTNLQSFGSRMLNLNLPRPAWVLIAGAISYLIMLTNVFSFILDALNYQGIAIVVWVGMALVHIAYVRRTVGLANVEFRPGRVPAVNPGGLGVAIGATVLGVVLKLTDPAFFGTWGLPLVFVVAAVLYAGVLRVAPERWFVLRRPADPLHEVDDPWEDRVRCHACDKSYLAREMDRDPTHGHDAVCAGCATGPAFYAAAYREAREHSHGVAAPAPAPAG